MKFDMPIVQFSKEEKEIWTQLNKVAKGKGKSEGEFPPGRTVVARLPKTGTEIALIPEICEMTGLTDQHRANFNLMKDLATVLHKPPRERREEAKNLI